MTRALPLRTTLLRRLLPYAACIVPLALYQALYTNGFYPITEGWFSEYAHLVRDGLVPYRDFPLLLPPLYTLQIAAFQTVFGEGFFALHILGIFVTCAIALTLLDILKHFIDPWIAAFAAVTGTIYYQSGVAFLGYDFTQFLTLYLLIGAALSIRSFRAESFRGRGAVGLCAGGGVFLGFAFLTKQSNAAVASLAVILAGSVCFFALKPIKEAIGRTAALLGGFCAPIAVILLWLFSNGAVNAFVSDVFVHAASAKGGLKVALFTWVWYFFHDPLFVPTAERMVLYLLALVAVMVAAAAFLETLIALNLRVPFSAARRQAVLRRIAGLAQGRSVMPALVVSVTGLIAFCVLIVAVANRTCSACSALSVWGAAVRKFEFIWPVDFYLAGLIVGFALLVIRRQAADARFFFVCALGAGLAFGNGTSAGLSEISMFLGMALLFGWMMQSWRQYLFPAFVPAAIALCFCTLFLQMKFDMPYRWWTVMTPPVQLSKCAHTAGIFSGLCLPSDEYAKITRIERDVEANSNTRDTIYVYPHMPVFYLATGRAPFDNAVVSWFDFMRADRAEKISRDLLVHPPAVIVMAEIPEYVLADHEKAFNGGKPLAQRKILASIAELHKRGTIERIDRVYGLDQVDIDVYRVKR